MGKRITIGLAILFGCLGVVWLLDYLAVITIKPAFSRFFPRSSVPIANSDQFTLGEPESLSIDSPVEPVAFVVTEVVGGLEVPWSMVFTDDSRIVVSERRGTIREVKNNQLTEQPLYNFSETARGGEIGLMGLALDPDYSNNKYLYACVGYQTGFGFADKVVVLRDNGSSLEEVQTIIDGIPAASNHAGCELAFGPDGMLYISTGDATEKAIAQDLDSLGGKILRITADGSIPTDNPFSNSAIYSYGHRNPQGFDWTINGRLYEAEHGPSGFDGPGGGDEINLITAGSNYGWPLVSHNETKQGTVAPLITYTPAIAPSSLLIYKGSLFPQFNDAVLVAALRGQGIYWLQLDPIDPSQIFSSTKLEEITVGRVRDIVEAPDGTIYFTTSNRDGRGTPRQGDDRIYQLSPTEM